MAHPNQTLQITRFQPTDEPGVINVILPIQQTEFGIPITAADQPDLSAISEFYQQGNGDFWVARAGEEVVGTIGLKDIGEGRAALRKMFVAQAYRGAAYGTASRLLTTLLEAARARGVQQILLGTTAQFLAAHRFYEKHGFHEVPKHTLPASFPLMAVDSKFYALDL